MSLRTKAAKGRKDDEFEKALEQERLILVATELIEALMDDKGLRRSDLAKLLGTTKGNVTQLLTGERNMTLRTLADLAFHTGNRIYVDAQQVTEPYLHERTQRRYDLALVQRSPGGGRFFEVKRASKARRMACSRGDHRLAGGKMQTLDGCGFMEDWDSLRQWENLQPVKSS